MSILFLCIASLSYCCRAGLVIPDVGGDGGDGSNGDGGNGDGGNGDGGNGDGGNGDGGNGDGGNGDGGNGDGVDIDLYEDVDIDDNGLMEVYFWEDLYDVRYVLDGSGRKKSAAGTLITKGETAADTAPRCKTGKLCGYELMRPLDFCNPEHFRVSTGVACTSVSEDPRNTPGDTSDDVSVQKPVSGHPFYNEGKGWEPLGAAFEGGSFNADASFSAVFEGNGRAITNLYVSERQYSGLFAVASAAEFHNLNLVDLYISSSAYSGGLVGQVYNTSSGSNYISITDSYVRGHVYSSSSSSAHSGGLVGSVYNSLLGNYNISITNSYASGTVSSSSAAASSALSGGLVGHVHFGDIDITNSYASGTVFSSSSSSAYSGGLVGWVYDGVISVTNSYVSSGVTSISSSSARSGGLVAYVFGGAKNISITESYVSGAVTSSSSSSAASTFSSGGLVSYIASNGDVSITKSYVSAAVTSSSPSTGGLIAKAGTGTLTINQAYYLVPTSGALQAVGNDNSFTTTEHQRTKTQLQGTFLQTDLGSAFEFQVGKYPLLRNLLPGTDGIFGPNPDLGDINDDFHSPNDLLGGQQ